MMNIIKKYIVLIIILSSLSEGCKKNPAISQEQEVFFQFEYINYAWGYKHYGYFIDSEGNVLTYMNPEKWNFPDANFMLTADQLAENISMCRRSGKIIPVDDLHKYAGYITNIASSKVTAPRNVAADAGSSEYICYQFSHNNFTYKGQLIKMEGDYTCENLNFFSKKVTAWMKDINDNLNWD